MSKDFDRDDVWTESPLTGKHKQYLGASQNFKSPKKIRNKQAFLKKSLSQRFNIRKNSERDAV